jgi:predicted DNA-binding protein with PD1-like motif
LEAGAEVRASVEALAKEHAFLFADVTGFGELESVELAGPGEGGTIALKGPFQLLDLKGRIRRAGDVVLFDLVCTLARATDNGIQLLGGKLLRGRTIFLELTLHPLHPAAPEKPAPQPAAPPPKTGAAPAGQQDRWARAIAESERVERAFPETSPLDQIPRRGDLVNHRQFGQCTVIRVSDDHITLRNPDRRNVQLGLSILRFTRAGGDGDRRVFDVEVARNGER